jgi:Ca2+-binding RTX toxin-like protein
MQTTTSRHGLLAKLALTGATALVGLAATAAPAHAGLGDLCSGEITLIFAKPGQVTYGTGCADKIIGTSGNDTIYALGGDDEVLPGTGNDTVWGGAGADDLETGSGDDVIQGEAGADFIMAGDGNDTVNGGADNDTIRGEDGNDILISYSGGDDGKDTILGGDGNDYLNGYEGKDDLNGNAGDDIFASHEANPVRDHFTGGTGVDTFDVKDAFEHDYAHRDVVDNDNLDKPVVKNTNDSVH